MARDILHFRLDSFFAVVEQRKRPNLHGRPVIVIGPSAMLRGEKRAREAYHTSGVVVSASNEAKRLGVKEGDSVRHAQRACPDAVIFKADYTSYKLVFEEFLDILSEFSPMLEPDSLGSAYMDVTAGRNLFGDPSELCARIMREVAQRLDMPLLIGCASNKLLAKIASGMGKMGTVPETLFRRGLSPFFRVRPGGEADFLEPLPVSALDTVNSKIEKRLGELGISNIGQLSRVSERALVSQFGPIGSFIRRQSLGIDFSPVKAAYPPEVINIEHTFLSAFEEPAQIEEHLKEMTGEAVMKLRKRNVLAGEITLMIFNESRQIQHAEQRSALAAPFDGAQDADSVLPAYFKFKKPTDSVYSINQALGRLLSSIMQPGMEVSKVRISLSELTSGESSQLCLIGDSERKSRLNRVTELLIERFGENAVFLAAALRPAADRHLYHG